MPIAGERRKTRIEVSAKEALDQREKKILSDDENGTLFLP
jgi:hypothetical protein